LYDLKADPSEGNNLIGQRAHAAVRERFGRRLDEFFDKYADPKYDLKRGGKSKTATHTRGASK
jgi:hypothetical protein